MPRIDRSELFDTAKERFIENDYATAEILLQQALLNSKRNPEVFHMLGTIYYDQGKFNKAIKSFRTALEIDPTYTDASVGLSIILNDLGRYEDGKKVFEEAQKILDQQSRKTDPYTEEKLAIKHEELGQMYFQCKRHKEALEQYLKAIQLSTRTVEIGMKIVDSFLALDSNRKAIKQLKNIINDYPQYIPAKLKLGKIYYSAGKVIEALEVWESILLRDSEHPEALRHIKVASQAGVTL